MKIHESNQSRPDQRAKILVCVNDNDHSHVALRFACSKAKSTGCPVELLTVIEPIDYQTFGAVEDVMRKEKQEEAKALLQRFSDEAYEWSGIIPSQAVREGLVGEEIVAAVEEDQSINLLILGTSPETPGRGKLLPWLANHLGNKLLIPMMIIPGNLTDQQIKELT